MKLMVSIDYIYTQLCSSIITDIQTVQTDKWKRWNPYTDTIVPQQFVFNNFRAYEAQLIIEIKTETPQ